MKALLNRLKENNILLKVVDGKLKVFAPGEAVPKGLLAAIREQKDALLAFLTGNETGNAQAPIPPAPPASAYPLSVAQRRIWWLCQDDASSIAYNMPGIYLFDGELNLQGFEYAFNRLIARHESLRTVFRENDAGEAEQIIVPPDENTSVVRIHNLSDESSPESAAHQIIEVACTQPFNLVSGPLVRAVVCRVAENRWLCCCVLHHIIGDGWSVQLLFNELLQQYNNYSNNLLNEQAPLHIQYKDYAVWQAGSIHTPVLQTAKKYWMQQFSNFSPAAELQGDRPRPLTRSYKGSTVQAQIDEAVVKALRTVCREQGATLFMGLLACVHTLLYRYTGQCDNTVGSPVAGRIHADLEDQIGCFVNTLPLRTILNPSQGFLQLLEHVRQTTLSAYEHQVFPVDELGDLLQLPVTRGRNPLFDVVVVLQNTPAVQDSVTLPGGLTVKAHTQERYTTSKFDLTFNFAESGDALKLNLEFSSDLFDEASAVRTSRHLIQLINAVTENPGLPLSRVDYLSAAEKHELLTVFNNTTTDYPRDESVTAVFEMQVMQTPEATALEFETVAYTYQSLNEEANRFARYLKEKHQLGPGETAAIKTERNEWLIISVLAVLKTGAAYIPVDTSYPAERISHMLRECNSRVLIDELFLAEAMNELTGFSSENLTAARGADSLAYIMYTSGSTGTPKGVMVSDRSIIRLVKQTDFVHFTGDETILSTGSFSFDATTFEYWGALLNGGRLLLCSQDVLLDANQLGELIRRKKADMMWFTAGWLHQLVDNDIGVFEGLKTVLAGGDKLSPPHLKKLQETYPSLQLINGYGPTENTTFSLTCRIRPWHIHTIPIGKPIANSTAFILDNENMLVPVGVTGEICVGGDGLSKGYFNNPGLTAEKFVPDPFHAGKLIYRTGDLGRWNNEGLVEFAGRKDDQLKIRGYRVEPGEIERALLQHPSIDDAVVVAKDSGSTEKKLVAYISGNNIPEQTAIRAMLGKQLPDYMLPEFIITLDALPLTHNGKVDRRNLPDPVEITGTMDDFSVAPSNRTEEQLLTIWKKILGTDQIGVDSDFFLSGGQSLKAGRLASQVYKELNVRLTLKEIFQKPKLLEQARLIAQKKNTAFTAIPVLPVLPGYTLSSAQKRVWIASQFEEGNLAYNIPGAYFISGNLNVEAMERAFAVLIQRHESLRTVFYETDDHMVCQRVLPAHDCGFSLQQDDLKLNTDRDALADKIVSDDAVRPFDLAKGPLLRARLLSLENDKHLLAVNMHHIISDEWSVKLFVGELLKYYQEFAGGLPADAPAPMMQYRDYAAWQQAQLHDGLLDNQKQYWLKQFEQGLPDSCLITDKVRPAVKSFKGDAVATTVNGRQLLQFRQFNKEQGISSFISVLALVKLLMYKYSGHEDIIIGTTVAGREHPDLEAQIGFYINTLALRTAFNPQASCLEMVNKVKDTVLDGFENQAYPFDELILALGLQRDMSRHPLFDVLVEWQDGNVEDLIGRGIMQGLSVRAKENTAGIQSKFDLRFVFTETKDTLTVFIEYCTDLFNRDTIERMAVHFNCLLNNLTAAPEQPVFSIDYMTEEERNNVVFSFNQTSIHFPSTVTVLSLIEKQAGINPDGVALTCRQTVVSYAQLTNQAKQLAGILKVKYGVGKGDRVGILLDRSEKMIVALLGILHAGAAYVPVDPSYPQARQEYIISDAGIKVLITQTDYLFDITFFTGVLFAIDVQLDAPNDTTQPESVFPGHEDLAYMIYTSGSTGKPKGCMITHGSFANYIQWAVSSYFNGQCRGNFGLFTSLSFDLTITSIFCALTRGATLHIYDQQEELSNVLTHAFSANSGQDSIKLTPSHINMLKHLDISSTAMACAVVGGEELTDEQVRLLKQLNPSIEIYNEYGPTETTVGCVVKKMEPDMPVLIGRPIANTRIYILDKYLQPCAVNIPGEICIAGAGLATGYLNQPELTQEKFVVCPFAENERIYRTGDIGKWLQQGELAFLGRRDEQVKIKGYRIETGEVERAVISCPSVSEALVDVRKNRQQEKELIAYYVSNGQVSPDDLRQWLTNKLPVYMVPAYLLEIAAIPLTVNGKADRKKLPDPVDQYDAVAYAPPRNKLEEVLVSVWQDVLEKDLIGIRQHFFQSGGDSIKVLRMISEVKKQTGISIPVAEMYRHSTIESIADYLAANRDTVENKYRRTEEAEAAVTDEITELRNRILGELPPGEAASVEDIYPMSDIEKGMIFESAVNPEVSVYHDQKIYARRFLDFDPELFRQAVQVVTDKHDILRSSFDIENFSTEIKFVRRNVTVPWCYEDISSLTKEEQAIFVRKYMQAEREKPFNFNVAPLWRMSVFCLGDNEYAFLLQCHHAVLDGWSETSLVTELNNVYLELRGYPGYKPPPLRSGYRDFIIQHLADKRDESIRSFWEKELEGCARLNLFEEGEAYVYDLVNTGRQHLLELEDFAKANDTTVKIISLSAYLYLLKVLNYDDEVVTGLVTHNRPRTEDADKILGCFLNTIPLRVITDDKLTAIDWIRHVQDKIIALKDNERLSMMEISLLHNKHQRSGNPFFDILFNFIDFYVVGSVQTGDAESEAGIMHASLPVDSYVRGNTFFDFSVSITGGSYSVSLNLRKKLKCGFSPGRVIEMYLSVLNGMLSAPQRSLCELNLLNEEDKLNIFGLFNESTERFPTNRSIVEILAAHAKSFPEKVAVRFSGAETSFALLHNNANAIARYLITTMNAKTDDLFGVMMDRSEKMMIAILGTWQAGSAYVPLDMHFPEERIQQIIAVSGMKALIVDDTVPVALRELLKGLVTIIRTEEIFALTDIANAAETVMPGSGDLAYVIYTSGSTGQPKGVMIEHFGMINHIGAKITEMGIDSDSRVAQNATHTFDISVWQMFAGPVAGGAAVIFDQETVADPVVFSQQVVAEEITVLETVPSYFVEMLSVIEEGQVQNDFPHLRIIILNAETLMHSMVKRWLALQPSIPIVNTYGATEASDDISHYIMHECPVTATVPVMKRPIQHFEVYIVNKHLHPVPPGITGEILLAGPAVGRGYLHDTAKTELAFLKGPLAGITSEARIYKTGDLGRFLYDGTLEFLGREDTQVKIRGHRIELGEIEQSLTAVEGIENATVLADTNNQLLVAYYQAAEPLPKETINEYLRKKLPAYMLPHYLIWLATFPLTPNGKINKRVLPAPDMSAMQTAIVPPEGETEEKLSAIWKEILKTDSAGRTDNFFDMGGHSLKVTRLAAQIHKVFGVKLPLRKLFATPVLQEQALLISNGQQEQFSAIANVQKDESYPLSPAQRRMWVMSQFAESNSAYNMPGVFMLDGIFEKMAFERALRLLTERHESLRTFFRQDDSGDIRQFILSADEVTVRPAYIDIRGEKNIPATVRQFAAKQFGEPFDLTSGPLWRVALLQIAENKRLLIYVIHHIISDGWSMGVLFREMLAFYKACSENTMIQPAPLHMQYKDYAAWQLQQMNGEKWEAQRQYWLSQFAGTLPVLELPGDYPRPAVKTFNGSSVNSKIDSTLTHALAQYCRDNGATLFMGLLAAVNALLYRYSGQDDIIVGSPLAGREHADLENQIGLYVNTVALRTRFDTELSFAALLNQVAGNTVAAFENQQYPFDELISELHLPRDTSRNALFEVMVVLQNAGAGEIAPDEQPQTLTFSVYNGEGTAQSKFDLVFNFSETGGEVLIHTEYNSDIYAKETINRLVNHFNQLLKALLKQPTTPVAQIDFLSEQEKAILLLVFNANKTTYPSSATLVELFEKQVALTPGNIALAHEGQLITYGELNEQANKLARHLKKVYKVKKGDLVMICHERGRYFSEAILAVLKTGAAYVPADPAYPEARIRYMKEDSGCKVVMDASLFDSFYAAQHKYEAKNLRRVNNNSDPAYVIYTSGSTGLPKGVVVEHRAVINLCYWHNRNFGVQENDKATLYAGVGFDASVWEFFPYLLAGATLYTVPEAIRLQMQELGSFYRNNKITISFLPTQVAEQFMTTGNNSLRFLLTGGDKLVTFTPVNYTVVNNYGPTENTVVATSCTIKQHAQNIPIDKPVDNNDIYILDPRRKLCPIGVVGEICISGDSLAQGYWANPDLTAEKFIPNPFYAGKNMYVTGDLGRWLPDGTIEFAGRKDEQVKIRGYRVEPAEIESRLLSYPGITAALVMAHRRNDGQNELVAYYVNGQKEQTDSSAMRAYLAKQLPAFMVPAKFMAIEAMPLTPNGKIDRKQLPDPTVAVSKMLNDVASNSTEEKILKCWKDVLGLHYIGVKDNFFELGGHSLTITRLAGLFYKEFGVKISFPELFAAETIEEQARLIRTKRPLTYAPIAVVEKQEGYPLSSAQQLFWLVSQFEEGNIAYNIPGIMQLEGELDTSLFDKAYHALIKRHEVLRTVFRKNESGVVKQYILPSDALTPGITIFDYTGIEGNEKSITAFLNEQIHRPFDLATGPLIRAFLIKTDASHWIFCYVIHHIIGDGWSMHILTSEWCSLYNAFRSGTETTLRPLQIQYKDYASWQREQLKGKEMLKQKAYWLKKLSGELPVTELKYDRPRPAVKTYNGDVVLVSIDHKQTIGFQKLLKENGATLFMGLLAAVNTLLYQYTGQEDIIVGTSVAGRDHADLNDQVGYYLNTLPLRSTFNRNNNFTELLSIVKRVTLDAYDNQQYPFEELVDALGLQRDISRSNLFDVFVVMGDADYHIPALQLDGIKVSGVPGVTQEASKFDITFNFSANNEGVHLYAEYNTDLFNRETIERLCSHFGVLLQSITQHPDQPIHQLNHLTVHEQFDVLRNYAEPVPEFQPGSSIRKLFSDTAIHSADEPVFYGSTLTYALLDGLAKRFALHYTEKGNPDIQYLIICTTTKEDTLIAMLGANYMGIPYILTGHRSGSSCAGCAASVFEAVSLIDDAWMMQFQSAAQHNNAPIELKSVNEGMISFVLSGPCRNGKHPALQIRQGSLLEHLHWNAAKSAISPDGENLLIPSMEETTATLYTKLMGYLNDPAVKGTQLQHFFSSGIDAEF